MHTCENCHVEQSFIGLCDACYSIHANRWSKGNVWHDERNNNKNLEDILEEAGVKPFTYAPMVPMMEPVTIAAPQAPMHFSPSHEAGVLLAKKKTKRPAKVALPEEPLATVIQEHPYKIYQIKRRVQCRDFLTWLNEVKDVNFGITMGKETIRFKTPRDVSNFMLGFNVCTDVMNGMY